MKELEKTKRISISAVLFLLVILIGFLTLKRPRTPFKVNSEQTLSALIENAHTISLKEIESMNESGYLLIDVRNNFDYVKGHHPHAINVPVNEFLQNPFLEILQNSLKEEKILILYGERPYQANNAWTLLYQLGFENIKILKTKTSYHSDQFKLDDVELDAPAMNYATVLEKAKIAPVKKVVKKRRVAPKPLPESVPQAEPEKKQVNTIPKKKKRMPEGGC